MVICWVGCVTDGDLLCFVLCHFVEMTDVCGGGHYVMVILILTLSALSLQFILNHGNNYRTLFEEYQ